MTLPDILVINCSTNTSSANELWSRKNDKTDASKSDNAVIYKRCKCVRLEVARRCTNFSRHARGLPRTTRPSTGEHILTRPTRNCRFGDKCARRGCRYIHGDGADASRDFGDFADSWLPFRMNIMLNSDGSVSVAESELSNEGTNYELTAIVCVIQLDGERLSSSGGSGSGGGGGRFVLFRQIAFVAEFRGSLPAAVHRFVSEAERD